MLGLIVAVGLALSTTYPSGEDFIGADVSDGGGSVEVVAGPGGTVGGGYAGEDSVMTCGWYSVGSEERGTHESYVGADLNTLILGATYYFQCFRKSDGVRLEAGWRTYNPPAGNPVANLEVVARDYAREALDRQQLPKPQLQAAPPLGTEALINTDVWVWSQVQGPESVTAELDAQNRATVVATPKRLKVALGDGSAPTVCDGTGYVWHAALSESDPRRCVVRPATVGAFSLTVTLEWDTTYTSVVAGQTFTGTLGPRETVETTQIVVSELPTHIRE